MASEVAYMPVIPMNHIQSAWGIPILSMLVKLILLYYMLSQCKIFADEKEELTTRVSKLATAFKKYPSKLGQSSMDS